MKKMMLIAIAAIAISCGDSTNRSQESDYDDTNTGETTSGEKTEGQTEDSEDANESVASDTTDTHMEGDTTRMPRR